MIPTICALQPANGPRVSLREPQYLFVISVSQYMLTVSIVLGECHLIKFYIYHNYQSKENIKIYVNSIVINRVDGCL